MKSITIITKVTSSCNLRCPYCYTKHTIDQENKIMSLDIFEKIIQNVVADYDDLHIIFHGGEPLLVPLEWYKGAVSILKKYKKIYRDFQYNLAMQSNITLMNSDYNDFFLENGISVGFSYDGTNNYKTRKNDEKIIINKENFKSIGGCICLITKDNINNMIDEIDYFDELNIDVQYNLVFNTTSGVEGLNAIKKEEILECYINCFNHIIKKEKSTSEKMFDLFIKEIVSLDNFKCCGQSYCIGSWLSVNAKGEIYPCGQEWDRFEAYSFGNINNNSFFNIMNDEKFLLFKKKFDKKIDICKKRKCIAFNICNGSCPGENKANGSDVDSFVEEHCFYMSNFLTYINDFLHDKENISKIKNLHILNLIKKGEVV